MLDIEQVWNTHQASLFAFVNSRVACKEDAQDILSESFAKLTKFYQQKQQLPDNAHAWLRTVINNSLVDYYRRKSNLQQLTQEQLIDSKEQQALHNGAPDSGIHSLSACLPSMINHLPDTYRQPLLAALAGNRYQNIAQQLNLSLTTIKSRILRGRKKLHAKLMQCCQFNYDTAGNIIDYAAKNTSNCSASTKKQTPCCSI